MSKIMRISSMVPGVKCAVMIDGVVKYFPVHDRQDKLFINLKGKRCNEDDLPMGEEVII